MRRAPLPGWVRAAGWLALLLGSLLLVTWRQTRGFRLEAGLREVQTRRANAEAERVGLVRRIEELRSRARIVAEARDRLGMHLPAEHEIVFLPAPVDASAGAPEEGP